MTFFKWLFHRFVRKPYRPRSRAAVRLSAETLEDRVQPSATLQSFDGTGNNLAHTDWGSANIAFLRTAAADYEDGISSPAGADRPDARTISNAIVAQPDDTPTNDRLMSNFIYAWGQFIDHDLDLTLSAQPAEAFNIPIPAGDPFFDPAGTGTQFIPLNRSAYDPATGITTPREQLNSITAWLDGSMIYGSSEATANSLRTFSGGKLKTSDGDLLPLVNGAFVAGDIRVNENPELTSLHVLFLREHNRQADKIAAANPSLTDEQVFQKARRVVIAELQAITFNEFLPALLGPTAPRPFAGYNPNVNPGIANEFSTAAFRIGHTLVGDDIEFLDNDGHELRPPIALKDAFFNPSVVQENGIDGMLKYLASDHAEEVDTHIVEGLRNFLFGAPGAGGLDLASLNIQRGRDHGLADYNSVRAAYGLPRVTSFDQITPDKAVQVALRQTYGDVNNIDLWIGGLAEKHLPGASVGPTFARIISDQFARLRAGDRFWYQNVFTGPELDKLEHTTLAGIIRANTSLTNLQDNVFFFKASIGGKVFLDQNSDGKLNPTERGAGGLLVELIGADGSIVASTRTLADGSYRFDALDLGFYHVKVTLPTGWTKTTQSTTVEITRGQTVKLDVGVKSPVATPPKQGPQGIASPLDAFNGLGDPFAPRPPRR